MKKLIYLFLSFVISLNVYAFGETYYKTIQVGETITIQATTVPASVEITNTGIVSVSYKSSFDWLVTGIKSGITTISLGPKSSSGTWSRAPEVYVITVVEVKKITIPSSLDVYFGENYTFSPIITDNGATTTLEWQSSNTSVAEIDANGKLLTTGVGVTTITCTAHNGVSAQCVVTVNPVSVTSITMNKSEAELSVGDQLQLTATVKPNNASDKSVTWSSTNEAVAVVNESGKVYAVGAGFSQIKAKANDGTNKTASCMVTVKDKTVLKGDVNGDGKVTVTDAEEVIDIILNNN